MIKKRILALLLALLTLLSGVSMSALAAPINAPKASYDDYLAQKVSLKKGSKGSKVETLVTSLCDMGYDIELYFDSSHNKYDSDVIKMVKSFQGIHLLKMTGTVGPELYAKICSQKNAWTYDDKRILAPYYMHTRFTKGEALVGFDIVNCSTDYTVDAYDFVLKGTNVYGELAFDETYYSNESCKIGPLKTLGGKKQYFILPVCEKVPEIEFAITRFHTKELGTIDVPRSEWRWIPYSPTW